MPSKKYKLEAQDFCELVRFFNRTAGKIFRSQTINRKLKNLIFTGIENKDRDALMFAQTLMDNFSAASFYKIELSDSISEDAPERKLDKNEYSEIFESYQLLLIKLRDYAKKSLDLTAMVTGADKFTLAKLVEKNERDFLNFINNAVPKFSLNFQPNEIKDFLLIQDDTKHSYLDRFRVLNLFYARSVPELFVPVANLGVQGVIHAMTGDPVFTDKSAKKKLLDEYETAIILHSMGVHSNLVSSLQKHVVFRNLATQTPDSNFLYPTAENPLVVAQGTCFSLLFMALRDGSGLFEADKFALAWYFYTEGVLPCMGQPPNEELQLGNNLSAGFTLALASYNKAPYVPPVNIYKSFNVPLNDKYITSFSSHGYRKGKFAYLGLSKCSNCGEPQIITEYSGLYKRCPFCCKPNEFTKEERELKSL